MSREKQIGEIRQGLAFVESYISIGRSANLTDPNIHAEEFVRVLLNFLFELNLVNTNKKTGNFPCIDLIDNDIQLGVQVTSEKGVNKIKNTLDCLDRMLVQKTIKNLKFFTLKPKQKSYKINKSCQGIKFQWQDDIIDFNDIMQEIVNIEDESKLEKIHSYIIRSTTIFTDYSTSIPSLYLPQQDQKLSWLSFSARSTKMVGREIELNALANFIGSEQKFSWWLISGPAGSGKSRLALELCYEYKEKGWDVGFLPRSTNDFAWRKFRPLKNTLIVIDYVVGRTNEVSDIVLELTRLSDKLEYSTRVLLLERDSHIWIKEFTREDSLSESSEIINAAYNMQYLKLSGLNQLELIKIAKDLVNSHDWEWDEKIEKRFIEWMKREDVNCRPLYAMLFSEFPHIEKPVELLRAVLKTIVR